MSNIGERLARIEALLEALRRDLLGDGGPGRIHNIEARLRNIEKLRWMIVGAFILLGLMAGSSYLPRIFARW
jgi:hypothetical protein